MQPQMASFGREFLLSFLPHRVFFVKKGFGIVRFIAGIFDSLFNLIKSVFVKKQIRLVGVDLSSTSVKLLELSKQGSRYRVECYAVAPLFPDTFAESAIKDVAAVGEAIKLAVARSLTHCKYAAVAVSSSSVITKVIQLDASLSDHEMEAQVDLEASRYYPLSHGRSSIRFLCHRCCFQR